MLCQKLLQLHYHRKKCWKNIKSGYRNDPATGVPSWYDSEWEFLFAECCKEANISCIREHFRVPYTDEQGKEHTYFPDFFVNGDTIVEVKGRLQKIDEFKSKACIKFAAARGLKFQMLKKDEFCDFIKKCEITQR